MVLSEKRLNENKNLDVVQFLKTIILQNDYFDFFMKQFNLI